MPARQDRSGGRPDGPRPDGGRPDGSRGDGRPDADALDAGRQVANTYTDRNPAGGHGDPDYGGRGRRGER
jgi:hypothetical protein